MEPNESKYEKQPRKRKVRAGIFISKHTLDIILRQKDRVAGMIALLNFYHYTALWQDTNQPRASLKYVAKGLHWGRDKVRAIRSLLLKVKLIGDIRVTDSHTGKVTGWYIRLPYFHPTDLPEGGFHQRVDSKATNACRSVTQNACKSSTRNASRSSTPRAARKDVCFEADLSHYLEEERELIDVYHQIICDSDPRWERVTKYTDEVSKALDAWTLDPQAFHDLCASVVNGNGEAAIPKRKTLVRLVWENF